MVYSPSKFDVLYFFGHQKSRQLQFFQIYIYRRNSATRSTGRFPGPIRARSEHSVSHRWRRHFNAFFLPCLCAGPLRWRTWLCPATWTAPPACCAATSSDRTPASWWTWESRCVCGPTRVRPRGRRPSRSAVSTGRSAVDGGDRPPVATVGGRPTAAVSRPRVGRRSTATVAAQRRTKRDRVDASRERDVGTVNGFACGIFDVRVSAVIVKNLLLGKTTFGRV